MQWKLKRLTQREDQIWNSAAMLEYQLTESAIVWQFEFISLGWAHASLDRVVNQDGVLLWKKCGCNLSVGFRDWISIYHSADVSRIAWHLLSPNLVSRTGNPVLRILTRVSVHILVHFFAGRQVVCAHHGGLERDLAHLNLATACIIDFAVNRTCSFSKEVVFQRHMTSVSWKVLACPHFRLFWAMLCRLRPRMKHLRSVELIFFFWLINQSIIL